MSEDTSKGPTVNDRVLDPKHIEQASRPNLSPVIGHHRYEDELGVVMYTTHADSSVTIENITLASSSQPR